MHPTPEKYSGLCSPIFEMFEMIKLFARLCGCDRAVVKGCAVAALPCWAEALQPCMHGGPCFLGHASTISLLFSMIVAWFQSIIDLKLVEHKFWSWTLLWTSWCVFKGQDFLGRHCSARDMRTWTYVWSFWFLTNPRGFDQTQAFYIKKITYAYLFLQQWGL